MEQAPAAETKTEAPVLEASSVDPLLDSLAWLTSYYGRAKSPQALTSGLPYDDRNMTPNLFCEAAERIGLKTRIVRREKLKKILAPVLPAILILKNGQACILLKISSDEHAAKIWSPETHAERVVKLTDLKQVYTGYAIYVHPRAEFTDPEAVKLHDHSQHWFWGLMWDCRGIYTRVMIAAVMINLFAITSPLFIMTIYRRVIPNNAIETAWVLAIGALTVFAFDFIMRSLRGYFIDLAARRVDVIATRRIYDQVLNMKLAGRPKSSGAFANMLRDFESIRDFVTSATMTALVDLPFAFLFLFIVYLIGGPIAFLLFNLIVLVFIIGMALQVPLKAVVRRASQSGEAKHGLLVESIHGLETVKAIGADGRLRARYGKHVAESALHSQHSRFISGLGVNLAALLQQAASILVVLMGVYLIKDSDLKLTFGELIACVMLGGRAIAPIGSIANLLSRYHQARNSLDTLNGIMEKPVERPAHKQFLHRPDLTGRITFDKLTFNYPGNDRKILDSVTFNIEPGEKVGLIGRIGSGKSTTARLIMGLYEPAAGTILMDDTDYRQIDPADLRRNVAYIAQDVILFSGSIRDNIAASVPHASEEEILTAAKRAGVHDFVSRHPMGYDAPVGERGEGLSGGQRQAVALARAMLLKPSVFVCDEPTNAMDMQAEAAFTKHIAEYAKNKTLILITHRQHLLSMVNRLILIDQGKIVMDGPRDKVLDALAGGKVEVAKG